MGPGRMIRQSFFTSADLTDRPAWARLLFAGMFTFASPEGLVRHDLRFYRNTVLSGLRIGHARVEHELSIFEHRLMIESCTVNSVRYYRVTNFFNHQRLRSQKIGREDEEKGKEDEEKGRERKDGCSEPAKRRSSPPPIEVPSDLKDLPLYAADVKLCNGWAELSPAWGQAFPGIDVVAEVRKAHAWEVANPARRKVNRPRFLAGWLARAQDSKHAPAGGSTIFERKMNPEILASIERNKLREEGKLVDPE